MTIARQDDRNGFFSEYRFWSEQKHNILSKYIDAYTRKRGATNSRIVVVDGFAGTGYYGNDRSQPGSPILLARHAQRAIDSNAPYRLFCINVERNRKRYMELRSALQDYDSSAYSVHHGTLSSVLPLVMQEMGDSPSICFLDPYGVVGMSVDDLLPLVQRPNTELLVNFSTPTVTRLSGSVTSYAREAAGKVQRVNHLLGYDIHDPSPEWLHQLNKLGRVKWQDWIVDRYIDQIRQRNPSLRYGKSYPVRTRHRGSIKYHLVFMSRYKPAFTLMSDFVCTEQDQLALKAEESRAGIGQLSFLLPQHLTDRERRYSAVANELHLFGLKNQDRTRGYYIDEFAFNYFGEFSQRHFRQMIDQLEQQGRLKFGEGSKRDARPIRFVN